MKYYHGTSSIFLESIIEFGLGGINPNIKFKNLELLKYLSEKCEEKIPSNEDYLKIRIGSLGIANQKPVIYNLNGGKTFKANYEHHNIYVSLAKERALFYACDNEYGSEVLECCVKMFQLLLKDDINFALPPELNLFHIDKYIGKKHKAILIEIDGIKLTELETEFGESAVKYFSELIKDFKTMNQSESDQKLGQANFRLKKTVKRSQMKIYEITSFDKINANNLEYTALEI